MKISKTMLKKIILLPAIFFMCSCQNNSNSSVAQSQSSENTYTVTFNLNGAPGNNSKVNVTEGALVGVKNINKESDGYYFNEWCIDPECTTPYDFSTPINNDLTLYASWNLHVFFLYRLGAAGNVTSAIDSPYISVKKDHTLDSVPECNINNGDRFVGWFNEREIPFNLSDPISKPELTYFAKFESFERTFNFYIDDNLIKTSTAGIEQNWVTLPTNDEVFNSKTDVGFKGWYTSKTEGIRFNFEGFDVKTDNYLIETTNVYARYEDIVGEKSLEEISKSYKNVSYGAKIVEGIGIYQDTYRITLDSNSSNDYYGVALYPTIFKGNLYDDNYVLDLDLGEFSHSGISIQPRIYILKADASRLDNGAGDLYTMNSKAESTGRYIFALNELKGGGDVQYEWNEDQYFQIGLEYEQPISLGEKGTIEINSISISVMESSTIDLNENYSFDLENFWGGKSDNCNTEYNDSNGNLRLVNVGSEHYGNYTHSREFNVFAGNQYQISISVDNFSNRCVTGEKRVEIWLESSSFNEAKFVGKISESGNATFDFSSFILEDCSIKFRFCFACADNCEGKIGYYTDEYVEISSLSILVNNSVFSTRDFNLDEFFNNTTCENGVTGTYNDEKYVISTSNATSYYGTVIPSQSWIINDFSKGILKLTLESFTGTCKVYIQVEVNDRAYYLDPQPNQAGDYSFMFSNAIDCELTGKQTIKLKFGIEDLNQSSPNSSYTISKLSFEVGD